MDVKTVDVAGLRIFYREAGDPSKPTIILLHGFPSSSYHFHDLIPRLADRFRVIAPDYPGMGHSEAGERGTGEAGCADGRGALFRWRPLRAR